MATTPNMNLTLPTVSQTTGPSWASQINTAFSTIDSHSHTPGNGVAITSAAININDDLSFYENAAINLSSIGLVNQASAPPALRLYASNNDLWYSYNGITPVQITVNGSIAGATGNISGMTPQSAVVFDVATGTFTFWSSQPTSQATIVGSQVRVRATTSSSPVTIAASPTASTYTLTLPSSTPVSQALVGFSTAGVLSSVIPNSTISLSSNSIGVAPLSITTGFIANNAVTQRKLENKNSYYSVISTQTVNGPASVSLGNFQANFVAGRPAYICLSGLKATGSVPSPAICSSTGLVQLYLLVQDPVGNNTHFSNAAVPAFTPMPNVHGFYQVPSDGTYTIQLTCYIPSGGSSLNIGNVALEAFQF